MNSLRSLAPLFILIAYAFNPASLMSQSMEPSRPIALFNGKDLSGFYTWLVDHGRKDPNRVFSVVDQIDGSPAIRISGQDWGGLTTRDSYRNYRLVVEFRWGPVTWGDRRNRARDSGVLLHAQGPDGNTGGDFNGPWMRSIEAQVIEGGIGDFILVSGHTATGQRLIPSMTSTVRTDRDGEWVYSTDGQERRFEGGRINWWGRDPDWEDSLGFRGRQDVESPYGEWTRMEVICEQDQITVVVNGEVVNRGWDASLTSGQIMIQSEGAEIYFREITIYPLKEGGTQRN